MELNETMIFGIMGLILVMAQAIAVHRLLNSLDTAREEKENYRVWLEVEQHKNQEMFKKGFTAGEETERERLEEEWRKTAQKEVNIENNLVA